MLYLKLKVSNVSDWVDRRADRKDWDRTEEDWVDRVSALVHSVVVLRAHSVAPLLITENHCASTGSSLPRVEAPCRNCIFQWDSATITTSTFKIRASLFQWHRYALQQTLFRKFLISQNSWFSFISVQTRHVYWLSLCREWKMKKK